MYRYCNNERRFLIFRIKRSKKSPLSLSNADLPSERSYLIYFLRDKIEYRHGIFDVNGAVGIRVACREALIMACSSYGYGEGFGSDKQPRSPAGKPVLLIK